MIEKPFPPSAEYILGILHNVPVEDCSLSLPQRELERKAEQEHMDELERRAREHHARSVLKYRGWKPWQRLVEMAREADVKATQLHTESLLR